MRITVLNWDKYNPRKGIKNPNWFALSNRLFEDSSLYGFTHSEMLCWIYILCECSRQNKQGTVTVNALHAHRAALINTTVLKSTIKKLYSLRIVTQPTSHGRYTNVHECNTTLQDKTIQDITIQDTTHDSVSVDQSLLGETSKEIMPNKLPGFDSCCQEWVDTMLFFKIDKRPSYNDKKVIMQLVSKHGSDNTQKAIAGLRQHPKNDKFDPGQWLAISKLLDEDRFELSLNRGSKINNTVSQTESEARTKKEKAEIMARIGELKTT